jgi:hypothetical protein
MRTYCSMDRAAATRHVAWRKRQAAFEAEFPTMRDQMEVARYVLIFAPDTTKAVMEGWLSLCDAYHQAKETEAFVRELDARGLLPRDEARP